MATKPNAIPSGHKAKREKQYPVGIDQRALKRFMVEAFNEMLVGQKHDPTGAAAQPYYGEGGLFSYPYARPNMFLAIPQPTTLLAALTPQESDVYNYTVELLTSAADMSGTNPDDVCGDPVKAGNLASSIINHQFGQFFVGSQVIDATKVGMRAHLAVQPRTIENWANAGGWWVPEPLSLSGINFASEDAIRLYEVGTALMRAFGRVDIDGNPAATGGSRELGWIKEMGGLSTLIRDDFVDIGGDPVEALYSIVVDWNDTASDGSVGGLTLAQTLYEIFFSLQTMAADVGMEGTEFALVMNRRLFRVAAQLLACTYEFPNCSGTEGNNIIRTAETLARRQSEMLNGQYLLIGDVPVRVLFSSGAEIADPTTEDGPVTGSIFIVPLRWNGRDLLYPQFFNMQAARAGAPAVFTNHPGIPREYINNGRYAWAVRSSGFCDQHLLAGWARLILETPFLAARIDNIEFGTSIGFRDWRPGASSFFGGGVSVYDANIGL